MYQTTLPVRAEPNSIPEVAFVKAYSALELLRFTSSLMGIMIDSDNTPNENYIVDEHSETDHYGIIRELPGERAAIDLVCGALQEHVTAPCLAFSPKVFDAIKRHRNGCDRNFPGVEGAVVALALAEKMLDEATDVVYDAGQTETALYHLLLGAYDIINIKRDLLSNMIAGFDEESAVEDLLAKGVILPHDWDRTLTRMRARRAVAESEV